jgi:hypothetical protein
MTNETEYPIEFDLTEGRWRITATYAREENVTVYLDGQEWRIYTYPGYKIWNIAAHLSEHAALLDHKLAVEQAEEGMDVETAREVWERKGDEDADPGRVEAAEKILTAAGWE